MATSPRHPFEEYSDVVDLGGATAAGPHGGFRAVDASGTDVASDDHHVGANVTLERGVILAGVLDEGMHEDRSAVVQRWTLHRASILRCSAAPLAAKEDGVAVGKLILACEGLEGR